MKTFFFLSLFNFISLFGHDFVIDNQTDYPNPTATIKLQWATSSLDMDDKTFDATYNKDASPLTKGKNHFNVPNKQKYFRIIVSVNNAPTPTYTSSWVLIVSDRLYTIKNEDLYLASLAPGSGC